MKIKRTWPDGVSAQTFGGEGVRLDITEAGIMIDLCTLVTMTSLKVLAKYAADDSVDMQIQVHRPADTGLTYNQVEIYTEG